MIATTTNAQTTEYIAKQISEVIDVIGSQKLLGVCTDNTVTMKCVWRILQSQYQEHNIAFYGCVAHILDLLIKDAMSQPSIDKLAKNGTAIVKEIKESLLENKHNLQALAISQNADRHLNVFYQKILSWERSFES